MKRVVLLSLLALAAFAKSSAQTGIGTTTPSQSAALDVSSTNKGFLPPRMTWTQIQAIPNPTPGLLVYDIGIDAIRMYTRNGWATLMPASGSASDAPGNFGSIQQGQFGGSIYVHALKLDASNNVFVAGHYFFAPSIGATTFPTASGSNSDAFFAKFDASGNLVLLKTFGSTGNDEINCIAVDGLGNIHVGGSFNLTVDFDPGASATSLTSSGLEDGFYARYDPAGNFSFVKKVGGTGNESVEGIAYDASNAMFIGGSFSSATVSVNGTNLTLAGGIDGFVASYNILNGNNNWVKQVGGTGNEAVRSVASNGPALVYGCGYTNSASLTVAGAGPYGILGLQDGFTLALNGSTGSLNSMLQVGDVGEICSVNDVAVDATGNYYYGGSFTGSVDLNPFGGISNGNSAGSSDGFLVKIGSGNAFQFSRTMGGTGGEVVTSIAANNLGYPYVTGYFAGTASFSIGSGTSLTKVGEGSFDIFLAQYHSSGNLLWLTTAGSMGGELSSVLDVNGAGTLLFDAVQMQGNNYRAFNGTRVSNAGVFYLARYEQ